MDDAMIAAGWTDIGEKTGLNMSGAQMVARMDEAGVDKAISHAIKMPHLNAHVPFEFVAGEVAKFPDRLRHGQRRPPRRPSSCATTRCSAGPSGSQRTADRLSR